MMVDADLDNAEINTLVPAGGKLPHPFRVQTGKLLDVIVALSPKGSSLTGKQRQNMRKTLGQKLYNKTRPGFYLEVGDNLHFGYVGQPGGANTQHHWCIYCTDELKSQIGTILAGTSLTTTGSPQGESEPDGKYVKEWGGLYLRSQAELRIAEALDGTGVLFFANARGRVGLQDTLISDRQLTGRVEADFIVFYQGRSVILEVDGSHHGEKEHSIRDYARDRVLLRSGLPTVRFTAKDCLMRPQDVVSEVIAILRQ